MHSQSLSSEASRPFVMWQRIIDWGQEHYRDRIFNKDERIPVRPGLLYLVQRGAVRLTGVAQVQPPTTSTPSLPEQEEAFLGFVGTGHPFEVIAQPTVNLQAYAHTPQTLVIWLYWHDLDNWPHFRREVLDALRYQHQRKLLWLSILGQRRTIDRLWGFLTLLIEEYGEPTPQGYCLPYPLTHAQIGSAIGSTRVTVTRLMGRLRQQGAIAIQGDNLLCLTQPFAKAVS
ncbi:Crp/Fnr family transcriptional regulator [Spirulina sp. CS-785/01]|uniref:Crp/Fnr family transcriptional regulator n=1 Tax=Spirulina sp. CS-785/01 TaxID=3021716 RepID=UPI00232FB1E0|nr:Crp/Fnr family transcriptional regulator [Spirulina sp. CS-785/01]MDB9311739.1 Crp/Fnr family transcriptional regulator [Spirulina sp. CS-785/01]